MEQENVGLYLGMDISEKYTMISIYQQHMKEPQTISTIMGSESYQIPTALAKKKGVGQWFFGREAKVRVKFGEALGVEDLLDKARTGEEVFLEHEKYAASDLLAIFLKRVLSLAGSAQAMMPLTKLVICLDKVSVEYMELFSAIMVKLGIETDKLLLIDRRESFYYYALSQGPETFLHDVVMFDYTESDMVSCRLRRNMHTTPQVINLDQKNHGKLLDQKDGEFQKIAQDVIDGQVVSAVYLIGDGFDGDWMKASLQYLCHTRKVFVGKNLYSKGACYAGFIKEGKRDWPFVYIGDNELKLNLYLKVLVGNEMQFFTLITAGQSWFDEVGECEVILDGTPEIEVWIQRPESREAHVELLELTDMVERERRTSRLRITAEPISDRKIKITIRDLGFGEIVPSSNRTWEHTVCLEE